MLRDAIGQQLDHDPNFRWRGEAVTRIENLSDIAFALALSMLIMGADAPSNVAELRTFLLSIVPTAAGFAILLNIWHGHYTFFRRYGVADKRIIFLNAVLIFIVLFMAYPLRFTFESLFATIIAVTTGDYTRTQALGVRSFAQSGRLVAYFAASYAATFALYGLMLGHVLKRKDLLDLNTYELIRTQQLRFARWGEFFIASGVAILAWFPPLYSMSGALLGLLFLPYVLAARRHKLPAQTD